MIQKRTTALALAGLVAATGLTMVTAANAAPAAPPAQPPARQASALPPGWQLVTLPNADVPNFQRRVVYCPGGKHVLGGGAEARGHTAILIGSFPTDDGRGWIGLGRQTSAGSVGISVFAICAD
jgi:hypothetical protein